MHVGDRIGQVGLTAGGDWVVSPGWSFDALPDGLVGLFSCLPSVNRAVVAAAPLYVPAMPKTGKPMSVSNYERLLRSFIDDNRDELVRLGVNVDEYSTHIYRRTTATLVERAAGLTIASRLLGHANETVTRNSYVITAEQVDVVTADILDTILGT